MATGELEKEDGILGNIPRHCILHALTVIEAAINKESSSVLDDFIRELTHLIYPKGKTPNLNLTQSLSQSDSLLIPSIEVNQFYENAITTQEFTIKVETRINEAMKLSLKKIDIDDIQMICWKYYSSEKKKALSFPKWLSPTCTYRLFIIFNQLLGDDMTVQITEQKMNYLLERIVLSCGFQSQAIVEVIKNNQGSGIAFPEFLKKITDAFEFLKLEMSLTCEMILDLLDEIVMGVLKKGYLIKRGGNRKNWKRRWFILKENTLFYYESRENLNQKGGMVLNKASDVISLPDEKGKLYRFVVTCGMKGRAFEIKAPDQRTKSEWMHAIKEAISLGRLKRNDLEDDADPCEMAAHYRLKYGISNSELTKSLPAAVLKHGHDSVQSSASITSTTTPTVQEMDSDSDSDQTGAAVYQSSPNIARRTKSHEPQVRNSFPTVDFRRQTPPKEGTVPSPKFRHSSYVPSQQSEYDKLSFTQEVHPGSRYVNVPAGNKSASSPSLQIPNHYDYIRHSITEEITEVYESSPAQRRHQYENLKRPMDTQEDDEYYISPDNQAGQDGNVTDQIYEDPSEDPPPLPPRESNVDNDGYLKIKPNHMESNTTDDDAHESVQLQQRKSAMSYTVSDYPEISDSAK